MENRLSRKISAAVLAVFVFMSMMYVSIGTVDADDYEWEFFMESVYYAGETNYGVEVGAWDDAAGLPIEATVNNAVSSNPDVIKIRNDEWFDSDDVLHNGFMADFKKPGKATITADFTKPDGTTATISKEMTVKKYPNQIKSLKVNGKKVTISKNKFVYVPSSYNKTKASINMKLKKGWKVIDATACLRDYSSGDDKTVKLSKSSLKKGKTVKFNFPKKYDFVDINIAMKKGNDYITYYIGIGR